MAHNGDDGDWCQNSASRPRMTTTARLCTLVNSYGPETIEAMRKENAFIDSVSGPWPVKKFTNRDGAPGRNKLLP